MWNSAGRAIGADQPESRSPLGAPLRLAFVSHCLNPDDQSAGRIGGAERAAAELLAALRRRDDVVVTPLVASAATDRLRFATFAAATLFKLGRMAEAGEVGAVLFTAMPTAWMSLALAPALTTPRRFSAAAWSAPRSAMATTSPWGSRPISISCGGPSGCWMWSW